MLDLIKLIINIGTFGLPEKEARRTRVVNMMGICTVICPFLYSLYYCYIGAYIPTTLNWIVIVLYTLTFYFNHLHKRTLAKIWILSIFSFQIFVLTKIIFSAETGMHYYFMAIPPVSFLIFDYKQVFKKTAACILPVALFIFCESTDIFSPLIVLSPGTNKMLQISSILVIFSGLIFIIFMFADNIKQNEEDLEKSIQDLETAMSEIKTLKGLIPICASCKKIRDDKGFWNHLESHIQKHSYATFSHGICPDCADKLYGKEEWYLDMKKKEKSDEEI